MTPLVLAAWLAVPTPADSGYRAALDLLYDGRFAESRAQLADLSAEHADDPMGPYLQSLVLCWMLEQRPESDALDRDFLDRVERTLALARARLDKDPADARARLAVGGAYAMRSRFQMFRGGRREAARDAARMREELLRLRGSGAESKDALFGLGLYDYYVDVLPRFVKFLRFLTGLPGGSRERGLARIEEAKEGTLFHGTEARVQLYEIYAYYENKPDLAYEALAGLRARYRGWPLWGLKLAEHLRERMGAYARSAEVAREVLEVAESGRHPNYQPVVAAMARVSLGESLLADLRLAEARAALLPVASAPDAPALAARAQLALGRSLELSGDRAAAMVHYRAALGSPDRDLRRAAQKALAREIPPAAVRGAQLLAQARRLREGGRQAEAAEVFREALRAWPTSQEAALFVAEDDLDRGRLGEARERLGALAREPVLSPPWIRPWTAWLRGRAHELAGERREALREYRRAYAEPCGQIALRERAATALERLSAETPSGLPPYHSK